MSFYLRWLFYFTLFLTALSASAFTSEEGLRLYKSSTAFHSDQLQKMEFYACYEDSNGRKQPTYLKITNYVPTMADAYYLMGGHEDKLKPALYVEYMFAQGPFENNNGTLEGSLDNPLYDSNMNYDIRRLKSGQAILAYRKNILHDRIYALCTPADEIGPDQTRQLSQSSYIQYTNGQTGFLISEIQNLNGRKDLHWDTRVPHAVFSTPTGLITDESYFRMAPNKYIPLINTYEGGVQVTVDNLITKIFTTPTGKNICRLSGGKPSLLTKYFGLSTLGALFNAKECASERTKDYVSYLNKVYDNNHSIIFFVTQETPVVDGWSNANNESYIMVKDTEASEDKLVRTIAHEIAISNDLKLTYPTNKSQRPHDYEYTTNKSLPDPIQLNTDKEKNLTNALLNPLIRYSFAAIRANKIEDKIAQELGYKKLYSYEKQTCMTNLAKTAAQLMKQSEIFFMKDLRAALYLFYSPFNTDIYQDLQTIKNGTLTVTKDRRTVSVCDYFSEPSVGLITVPVLKGGPRPRVTGGWGSDTVSMDLQTYSFEQVFRKVLGEPADSKNVFSQNIKILLEKNGTRLQPQTRQQVDQLMQWYNKQE